MGRNEEEQRQFFPIKREPWFLLFLVAG